jgi:putative phage-type endonuclease
MDMDMDLPLFKEEKRKNEQRETEGGEEGEASTAVQEGEGGEAGEASTAVQEREGGEEEKEGEEGEASTAVQEREGGEAGEEEKEGEAGEASTAVQEGEEEKAGEEQKAGEEEKEGEALTPDTMCLTPAEQKIASLRARELSGDQRSGDWLAQRNNYITASTSAACAGLMGKVARSNMLREKIGAGKSFFGNVYTRKGNLFEPVTNMIYSKKTAKTIHMFNLIPAEHADWGFLGASTDGVTNTLENIEIKTLARRAIGKVKREYHHQMQHQMFCLDLNRTHFIEAKYDEWSADAETLAAWRAVRGNYPFSGAIVELPEGTAVYSPLDVPDPEAWVRDLEGAGRTTYWVLTDYQCLEIPRDPTWITGMGPLLQTFWEEVVYYRAHPDLLPPVEKKIKSDKGDQDEHFKTCLL